MSTRNLTPDQRAKIAELIGDAQPATTELLVSFGESIRDRRDHEHPQWEDFYCLNLSSYMGERMAPVLRRLLDAESRAERYRTAWGMARTRAISTGGAADRYAARAREGQEALQHMLFAVIAAQLARKAATDEAVGLRNRVAELEAAERARVRREQRVALVAGIERAEMSDNVADYAQAAELRSELAELEAEAEADASPIPSAAELEHLRNRIAGLETIAGAATEFRVWNADGMGLYVRRAIGTNGFAVLEGRIRAVRGRRAWTSDGWRFTALLSEAEVYCWPDASTALTEAQRLANEDTQAPAVQGDTDVEDGDR
ncbi:hypothetical protein [Streptomyces scabiei]|uniref:Uncharacterized protein n=1 Tax=Streptomyces scabiei TaxID=1930 RepID=A0A100JR00_STRSC|nr:hypothetical protein [Streptomyces scabiei]GAQ64104.1 hypothetical protein SsS58_04494 [Streptomyces scabiei]